MIQNIQHHSLIVTIADRDIPVILASFLPFNRRNMIRNELILVAWAALFFIFGRKNGGNRKLVRGKSVNGFSDKNEKKSSINPRLA